MSRVVTVPALFHSPVDNSSQTGARPTARLAAPIGFIDRSPRPVKIAKAAQPSRIQAEFADQANMWQYMPLREAA